MVVAIGEEGWCQEWEEKGRDGEGTHNDKCLKMRRGSNAWEGIEERSGLVDIILEKRSHMFLVSC